jgi:hypothetical protein
VKDRKKGNKKETWKQRERNLKEREKRKNGKKRLWKPA